MAETQAGLKFYPASHRYRMDGEWVPGVTTILNVLSKPGLTKWAATAVAEWVADHEDDIQSLYAAGRGPMVGMLKEVPWQASKDAATRGTTFHEFAERIVNGEDVDVPPEQVPLVESALAFMEDYDVQPVLVEACVGSREHQYAGKLDMIADSRIGRIAVDWKSGKKIYPSTALQIAAYVFAEFHGEHGDEHPLPEVEASYGVHIRDDGYSLIPLRFGPDVFADFLAVREAFAVNKRVEGNWKEPGSGYAGIEMPAPVTLRSVS